MKRQNSLQKLVNNGNEKKINVKINKLVYLGLLILQISETITYDVGMIVFNETIGTMQIYVTWIRIALLCILKLNMFMKTLQMMLKKDLEHQIVR